MDKIVEWMKDLMVEIQKIKKGQVYHEYFKEIKEENNEIKQEIK